MKYKKNVAIIIIAVLIVSALIIFLLNSPKNCGTSDNCFNTKASSCKLAKAELDKEGNTLNYQVTGKSGDDCIINVKMVKLAEIQPADLKKALEGKDMKCVIPQFLLREREIKKIQNLNDYCTGQLKESVQSITIEK